MAAQHWHQAQRLLQAGRLAQARAGFEQLLALPQWVAPARLRLAQIALREGSLQAATGHALAATQAAESEPAVLEALCGLLCQLGEIQATLAITRSPALADADDPQILAGIGKLLIDQSLPEEALPLLLRARRLGLDDAGAHYLVGLARLYCGELDAAERDFEACLARAPLHAACHRALSGLRRASAGHNHVQRLRQTLAAMGESHPDSPPLLYALFKQLDDLDDRAAAWQALDAGMRRRRAQLRHDRAAEAALFERLHAFDGARGTAQGCLTDGPLPVFIIGQPRSGTTLLERLLSGSPDIRDAGELRDFGFQLRYACDSVGPPQPDADLIERAGALDLRAVGERYLARTQWRAQGRRFYTDKLPTNFLLLGLIARALPQARFLHMTRAPMDVCFSNLKELFADAYPHSYDQEDMACHYRRYHALMAHWRQCLPDRLLELRYADLVRDPAAGARRVLDFLGARWDDDVVRIDARPGGIATASSVQLREPVHARNVDGWRRYADQLGPLRDALDGLV